MAELLISFAQQNLQVGKRWLFKRCERMRFEWLALLALKRTTEAPDQSWITLKEIAKLPSWRGKSRHHIATNVGRYLQSRELKESGLVDAGSVWSGPYRLNLSSASVKFDLPRFQVMKALQIRGVEPTSRKRRDLLEFTLAYTRAYYLMFQGRLSATREHPARDNAYDRLAKAGGKYTMRPDPATARMSFGNRRSLSSRTHKGRARVITPAFETRTSHAGHVPPGQILLEARVGISTSGKWPDIKPRGRSRP